MLTALHKNMHTNCLINNMQVVLKYIYIFFKKSFKNSDQSKSMDQF